MKSVPVEQIVVVRFHQGTELVLKLVLVHQTLIRSVYSVLQIPGESSLDRSNYK
jgi:hypothetical protein